MQKKRSNLIQKLLCHYALFDNTASPQLQFIHQSTQRKTMLSSIERGHTESDVPRWWFQLKGFVKAVGFLVRHRKVIQLAVVLTPDAGYQMLIRYSGLTAEAIEQVMLDYAEHIKGERSAMRDVREILGNQ